MPNESRASMVASAASLIRTRGLTGTSLSDVLADSGAPRGSIYHHFPEGKAELAADAIRWTAERVVARQRDCAATTASGVLDCFIDMWRRTVLASGGTAGCVVAGVALDTDGARPGGLIDVVRPAFRSWIALLTEQLVTTGLPGDRAASVALTTVATMEGALILCRAEGDVGPLEVAAAELRRLVAIDEQAGRTVP